jgi:hypothetical protein
MDINNVCKIPGNILTNLKRMEEKEGVEAIYIAIAQAWVDVHLPTDVGDIQIDSDWLSEVESSLELSIPYSPNIFNDEESWNDYIGEVVGVVADLEVELHEHFSRVVPRGFGNLVYVEPTPVNGEVVWIWKVEI